MNVLHFAICHYEIMMIALVISRRVVSALTNLLEVSVE